MACESFALFLLTWSKSVWNNLFAKGAKIIEVICKETKNTI
jgi:hypothetical protein